MSNVVIIDSLVGDELLTIFVDSIVSQVHTEIVEVAAKWCDVLFGSKSG